MSFRFGQIFLLSPMFYLLLAALFYEANSHWWSIVNRPNVMNSLMVGGSESSFCSRRGTLSRNQRALCRRYINHMQYVQDGAKDGVSECKFQFRNRRWNCSTFNDKSVFGKVMKTGSRETAFTYAISAAGVVVAVARACKNEQLPGHCGCSNAARPNALDNDWNWGGCGDNVEYAYGFAREFIDARERDMNTRRRSKRIDRREMNKHNNEAGRLIAVRSATPTCKCHGVSGSCSLKTCWMQIPSFRKVGDQLMRHYEHAIEVRGNKRGRLIRRRKSPNPALPTISLVYLDSSPDYCIRNKRNGVHGTKGRQCQMGTSGAEGCGLMCCGRGYNITHVTVSRKCNCKFHWCCSVQCETCNHDVERYVCK